ncbi:hypothetical protein IMZ31_22530 (plasmid) [Pontibacillus sp. ALD_SL1]|uniref:hypothetical protein n=1 Tax=Pontibacillus sp. ALD_SL1 TaxID=2777185 RepID=UPI001A96781F|nr:hypothetical protein [Pontibacillus sp. ALD_SL1]QST02233.1 hypothetical protein IMZ31_22530 [Pontibacillus sp. ALD_SL1]
MNLNANKSLLTSRETLATIDSCLERLEDLKEQFLQVDASEETLKEKRNSLLYRKLLIDSERDVRAGQIPLLIVLGKMPDVIKFAEENNTASADEIEQLKTIHEDTKAIDVDEIRSIMDQFNEVKKQLSYLEKRVSQSSHQQKKEKLISEVYKIEETLDRLLQHKNH